jgi:hypothetical protein
MHYDDSTPVLQPSLEETACDAVHITEDLLSVSTSNTEEYVTDSQREDLESETPSPATRRAKVTVEEDRPDLSPLKIDSILSACVPDTGLFSISKVRKSVCTHDSLKEKLLLSRFVPDKTWMAPKHACGKYNQSFPVAFFDSERYPSLRYSVLYTGKVSRSKTFANP